MRIGSKSRNLRNLIQKAILMLVRLAVKILYAYYRRESTVLTNLAAYEKDDDALAAAVCRARLETYAICMDIVRSECREIDIWSTVRSSLVVMGLDIE